MLPADELTVTRHGNRALFSYPGTQSLDALPRPGKRFKHEGAYYIAFAIFADQNEVRLLARWENYNFTGWLHNFY